MRLGGQIKIQDEKPKDTLKSQNDRFDANGVRFTKDNVLAKEFLDRLGMDCGTSQGGDSNEILFGIGETKYEIKIIEKDSNPINIKW